MWKACAVSSLRTSFWWFNWLVEVNWPDTAGFWISIALPLEVFTRGWCETDVRGAVLFTELILFPVATCESMLLIHFFCAVEQSRKDVKLVFPSGFEVCRVSKWVGLFIASFTHTLNNDLAFGSLLWSSSFGSLTGQFSSPVAYIRFLPYCSTTSRPYSPPRL